MPRDGLGFGAADPLAFAALGWACGVDLAFGDTVLRVGRFPVMAATGGREGGPVFSVTQGRHANRWSSERGDDLPAR
ncbi:MAG TPA: hypothetical protein DDY91_08640 [Planctomycetaceae bacterium]|nr:hypothetical protein [Planctomycetaceae bacterium]